MTLKATMYAKGIVQEVHYRDYVAHIARVIGIRGLVRNLKDGRVEIYCEAPNERAFKRFLKGIDKKGDPEDYFQINVEELQVSLEKQPDYRGPWRKFEGFEIDREEVKPEEAFGRLGLGLELVREVGTAVRELTNTTKESFASMGAKYDTISKVEGKIDRKLGGIDRTMGRADQKLGKMDEKMGKVDQKLGGIDEKQGKLGNIDDKLGMLVETARKGK